MQERDEQKAQRAKKERKLKLSFGDDEEEEEEEKEADGAKIDDIGPQVRTAAAAPAAAPGARGFGKDPTVRSDFLPDREREREEEALREQLKSEWLAQQAAIKAEPLEITYSYYNGTGHRRSVTVTKGATVGQFLQAVYEQLAKEFREMKWVPIIFVLGGKGVLLGRGGGRRGFCLRHVVRVSAHFAPLDHPLSPPLSVRPFLHTGPRR